MNKQRLEMRGELGFGEPHPMCSVALDYIRANGGDLYVLLESMSSCAIEGNRTAEVCAETLNRLINGQPVSDRYLMGLAWFIYSINQLDKKKPKRKRVKSEKAK